MLVFAVNGTAGVVGKFGVAGTPVSVFVADSFLVAFTLGIDAALLSTTAELRGDKVPVFGFEGSMWATGATLFSISLFFGFDGGSGGGGGATVFVAGTLISVRAVSTIGAFGGEGLLISAAKGAVGAAGAVLVFAPFFLFCLGGGGGTVFTIAALVAGITAGDLANPFDALVADDARGGERAAGASFVVVSTSITSVSFIAVGNDVALLIESELNDFTMDDAVGMGAVVGGSTSVLRALDGVVVVSFATGSASSTTVSVTTVSTSPIISFATGSASSPAFSFATGSASTTVSFAIGSASTTVSFAIGSASTTLSFAIGSASTACSSATARGGEDELLALSIAEESISPVFDVPPICVAVSVTATGAASVVLVDGCC